MGCCSCCGFGFAKCILVFLNFNFMLCGAALLAGGIWVHFDKHLMGHLQITQSSLSGPYVDTAVYILMGVGAVMIVISFLGCCGACCESMCLLGVYSFLLFVIIAAEVTAAVLTVVYRQKIHDFMQKTLQNQIKYEYKRGRTNTTDTLTMAWDTMHVQLHCCGSTGSQDFEFSYWRNTTKPDSGISVPATCCNLTNDDPKYPQPRYPNQCQIDGYINKKYSLSINTKGCHEALLEWLSQYMGIFIGVACGVFVIQVVGFICACCLIHQIRRRNTKYPWYDCEDD